VQRDDEESKEGRHNQKQMTRKVKQPLFQFRYNEKYGKFVREIKDNEGIDNACKDPMFFSGLIKTNTMTN